MRRLLIVWALLLLASIFMAANVFLVSQVRDDFQDTDVGKRLNGYFFPCYWRLTKFLFLGSLVQY